MVNDTTLMEAESLFYESLAQISSKANLLQEYSHLVNFTSTDQSAVDFRKTFYGLMNRISEITYKTTEMFELICQSHYSEYK